MEINKILKWAVAVICLVPIIVYLIIVYKFSDNIPFWDDYDAILGYLTFYVQEDFPGKVSMLFQSHNEHRIFLVRVITISYYYLFGEINFIPLIYIGNTFYVGVFVLVYKVFKNDLKINLIYFIPIPIILFQTQYFTNSVWAMASLQNFGILFVSLLSLYLLHKEKFVAALIIGVLAIYTSGNGLLVFPIGAFGLWIKQRRGRLFYIWCAIGVIAIGLYFFGYKSNPEHPSIWEAILNPLNAAEYLLNFTGSYFKIWRTHTVWAFSAIILMLICLIVLKKYYLNMPMLSSILLFLILTACLTTLSRSGFGASQAFTDRYRMYSAMFVAISYLMGLRIISNDKFKQLLFTVVLIISVLNNSYSFTKYYPRFENHQTRLELSNAKPYYPHVDIVTKTLKRSEKLGIYKLPTSKSNYSVEDIEITSTKNSDQIEYAFDIDDSGQCYFIDNGWAFLKSTHDATDDSVYIVLSAKNNHHLFRTYQIYRPDVSRHFKKELDYSGFHCAIPKNKIDHKKYEVGILIISEGKDYYQKTNKTIQRKRAKKHKKNLKPPQ